MSEGPAHQARVGLGSSHSRSASERAWSQPFPGSAGSGNGDMRGGGGGGGGKGAALLLLLASVLWVTVQSQQRGEPHGRNTGDPGAGERERAGTAGQSAALRAVGWAHAPWRRADLLRAAPGWDTGGGGPPAPEDRDCSRSLRLRSPLAPRTGEAGVGGGGPPLSSFRGTLSSSSAVDGESGASGT